MYICIMDIKGKFLSLTKKTYPHGTEEFLENQLPKGFEMDGHGNYFLKIGDSRTMFTCHLDTACSKHEEVTHILDGQFIKSDGSTILGADDKSGMVILLYMIEKKVPGTYYFFIGEEVGCVGSRRLSSSYVDGSYDRCISFDRRGYNSIITHQLWSRCCSEDFANSLKSEINKTGLRFQLDDGGMVTDSASFMDQIPECTNISVGYFNEHTTREMQDIGFLEKLCVAVSGVDWESLHTRDMNDLEGWYEDEYEDYDTDGLSLVDHHDFHSETMNVRIGEYKYTVRLKFDRLLRERSLIYEWIISTGSYHDVKSVDWNGVDCYLHYQNIKELIGSREDLVFVIDELNMVKMSDLVILKKLT